MNSILKWQLATVRSVKEETPHVKTLTLALPEWTPHRAGQHYDVRLTAPDGYQAQRSYSVVSQPERVGVIELTVERLADGEVSPYLCDVLVPDDRLEVRGPIGGYFVWEAGMGGPLLLVAGGSGVVPLMAIVRHRRAVGSSVPACLLYSVRSPDEVIFAGELDRLMAQMDDRADITQALMLDANAVAGPLREIFNLEMTVSVAECARCGSQGQVGTLLAFMRGPGIVLRCPKCENIVLRITRTPGRIYLDARGAAYLSLPLAVAGV